MNDLLNNLAQIDALADKLINLQEQFDGTFSRLFAETVRLTNATRQAIAKQQLGSEKRYTEREAAEALRVNVATLRGVRRRQFERDASRWPHYTLEGVVGYFYTEAHLSEIASRGYLEQGKLRRVA